MKPSAERGLWLAAVAAIATATAMPIMFTALVLTDPGKGGADSPWLMTPFYALGLIFGYPAWRGRVNGLRLFAGLTLAAATFAGISLILIAFAESHSAFLRGAVSAACGIVWVGSALLFVRSRDVRAFWRRRHAVRRLQRLRHMRAVAAHAESLRAEYRAGKLAPAVAALRLPPLPPADADGSHDCELPGGHAGVALWWQFALAFLVSNGAREVCYYPHRSRNPFRCRLPVGGFLLDPPPFPNWVAYSRPLMLVTARNPSRGWARVWASGGRPNASSRVRLQCDFGPSEWLLSVWQVDTDWGVEWHRLDIGV